MATNVQPPDRKSNVFSPRQSRYIQVGAELQRCLAELFPKEHKAGYKFNIQVCTPLQRIMITNFMNSAKMRLMRLMSSLSSTFFF